MLSLASLALLSSLFGAPSFSLHSAELGGVVAHGSVAQPIALNLYSGDMRVASATADLSGKYSLVSPPGDYWLQILVGDKEQRFERVLLGPGSWQRDFKLGVLTDEAWVSTAPVCDESERDRAVTALDGDHEKARENQST